MKTSAVIEHVQDNAQYCREQSDAYMDEAQWGLGEQQLWLAGHHERLLKRLLTRLLRITLADLCPDVCVRTTLSSLAVAERE